MNTVTAEENTTRGDNAQETQQKKTDTPARGDQQRDNRGAGGRRRNERGPRRQRKPRERVRSEFDQQIISIRRVTRVVAGGRRFSFSVAMVVGNRKGKVGVGLGKGTDTALAIEKAARLAKKNLITVPMTEDFSIPHQVEAKYASSDIKLMPAHGGGLRAGSSVRTVLELAGVKQISSKILSRSKNRLNNAQATITALQKLKPVAKKKNTADTKKVAEKKAANTQ